MKGREKKRKRETIQGRQGTYTEVTATWSPFPPLLYEHREDTHIHTKSHKYTKGVVTQGAYTQNQGRERSEGREGWIETQ